MSVRVFAPAKVNLTLKVGPPRADGFHPLQSVVAFADVGDVIEAEAADALSLAIHGDFAAGLEADENNLVLRAARALAERAGVKAGAKLTLEKNLPIASGIGGGSSDAAATLRALNMLWDLNLSVAQLADIARPLGADVPVCVAATPAFMSGTGAVFEPLSTPAFAAVLINPLQPLPTPAVYRAFDCLQGGADFAERGPPRWQDATAAIADIKATGNDLFAPALALMPAIGTIAEALKVPAVRYAGLSGSGATMFALLGDAPAAEALADALQQAHPEWWIADATLGGA